MRSPLGTDVAHARLVVALQAADVGLWEWDPHTEAWSWDTRSTSMLELDQDRLTHTRADLEQGVDPADLPGLTQALQQAVATGAGLQAEVRVRDRGEEVRWVSMRGRVLIDADDRVVRVVGTCTDSTASHREADQRADDAAALKGLVSIARDLGEAHTETDVLAVVTGLGTPLLGAQAMGLVLLEADRVRTLASDVDADFLASVAHLPLDLRLPMVDTAVTGEEHFFPDLATAAADFPDTTAVYTRTGTQACAAVPLATAGKRLGALSVAYREHHAWRQAERDLLTAFATLTAQALERIRAREAEVSAHALAEQFSETMQRSLLTWAPPRDHLQVDVRYVPASAATQVGGDWYDAFTTTDGTLTVVIGDVSGHDQVAAAAMGQLRNLTRGIAHTTTDGPAAILRALDRAISDLQVQALATIVIAQVHPLPLAAAGPGGEVDGQDHRWLLRWSNAGHLPPLLVDAGGGTAFLEGGSDLLAGLLTGVERRDHEVVLEAGSSVLMYTDGLVERRGAHLPHGLDWLAGAVTDLARAHPHRAVDTGPGEPVSGTGVDGPAVCDALLELVGPRVEDDVALLLLHARPHP